MKKKNAFEVPLWTQENPDICRFCAFAKPVTATEDVYCEKKKTFLNQEETCRKFKYDILKKESASQMFALLPFEKWGDFDGKGTAYRACIGGAKR